MIGFLRGTEDYANESTFTFDTETFELTKYVSKREPGCTDIMKSILSNSPYRLFNSEHVFDMITVGEEWVKSKSLDFYVRVLRPFLYKEYVVEAWWEGKLYRITKTYGDDKVYINDKYFRWEKGEGEVLCVGVYDGDVYFWLKYRTTPQKVSGRYGVNCERPSCYREVLASYSTASGRIVDLDYNFPVHVSKDKLSCGSIEMSISGFTNSELLFNNKLKTGQEVLSCVALSVLKSKISEDFEIIMIDSERSFHKMFEDNYLLANLMGNISMYLHNVREGYVLFTLGSTVYKIDMRTILGNQTSYLQEDIEVSDIVLLLRTSTNLYLYYKTALLKIVGGTVYDVENNTVVCENCISDLSVEAVKRQYTMSNA